MNDLDVAQKASHRWWIAAAIVSLALHVGGATLALMHLTNDEADDALGAPAIEIAMELNSPRLLATDLPPGPDSDVSVASPALVEQQTELNETELPKAVPTDSDRPDRLVTPNDARKPEKDDSRIATVRTAASQQSMAAIATATPSSDHSEPGPRAVAPVPGSGETALRVRATWQKELVAHLDKHKRYPSERVLQPAEIVVGFVLDRMGHVLSMDIVKGSGDPAFDAAALAMFKRSDPLPPPPPLVADEGLYFSLPVIFRVKGKS